MPMNRIRAFLQSKRKPMNNDEWTVFAEKLTPAQRAAVEQARAHYFDDALKSYLVAFLRMLEGHEEHLSGLRQQTARFLGNQELVTEHLNRQSEKFDRIVSEVGAVGSGLAALTDQFRQTGEALNEWQTGIEGRIATVEAALAARPSVEETRELVALIRQHDQQIAILQSRLDARPSPEEAQQTYNGVQRILEHLGLDDHAGRT